MIRRFRFLAPLALAAATTAFVAAFVAGLGACDGGGTLRPAFETYEARVRPLMDKEQKVYRRIGVLLADEEDKLYLRYLEDEALPFYTTFREKVQAVAPGHEQIETAHDLLTLFADARLEFVNGALQVRDALKHLRNVERVNQAEMDANAANAAYMEALGNEPPDARFGEISQISDSLAVGYMHRLAAGELAPEEVAERLRHHVLPRLEEIRNTKYRDDAVSQKLRDTVVACQTYHRTVLEEMDSIDAAFTSRRRTQQAVNRGDRLLQEYFEELKRIRRLR